jgi:transcriptional regulator with XRE-family HTH domain
VRALRLERGWTQERAAEKCGIGYKLFQLYELGIKKNPSLQSLEKIAHGFGLDVSELLAPNPPKVRLTKTGLPNLPVGKLVVAKAFFAKRTHLGNRR